MCGTMSSVLIPLASVASGLAALCTPVLTMDQIYQLARDAGFPSDVATQMTAIAMRESGGCPNAHNPGTLGVVEDSYGLWQINALGNAGLLTQMGITPAQLYDPATNAAAAFRLWNGSAANLNTAWSINKSGPPYYYQEKYQQYLPAAQLAQARVEGTAVVADAGDGSDVPDSAGSPTLASVFGGSVAIFGTDIPIAAIAAAGLALGLLIALTGSSRR